MIRESVYEPTPDDTDADVPDSADVEDVYDAMDNQERGAFAEKSAAAEYGYQHDAHTESWYDAIHPERGSKVEVKSAQADRRFRLWQNQQTSLQAADSRGTAWYVFAVWDGPRLTRFRRTKPRTVGAIVSDRGGWNDERGPTRGDTKQHKLPVAEIFDVDESE